MNMLPTTLFEGVLRDVFVTASAIDTITPRRGCAPVPIKLVTAHALVEQQRCEHGCVCSSGSGGRRLAGHPTEPANASVAELAYPWAPHAAQPSSGACSGRSSSHHAGFSPDADVPTGFVSGLQGGNSRDGVARIFTSRASLVTWRTGVGRANDFRREHTMRRRCRR